MKIIKNIKVLLRTLFGNLNAMVTKKCIYCATLLPCNCRYDKNNDETCKTTEGDMNSK